MNLASPSLSNPHTLNINGDFVEACPCGAGVSRSSFISKKADANYYKSQFERASKREKALKEEIKQIKAEGRKLIDALNIELEELKAERRKLKQKLFGKRGEQRKKSEKQNDIGSKGMPARKRGGQRGANGHNRREQPHLPVQEELVELPHDEQCCSTCHLPFKAIASTEDSEVIEIEVSAHKRVYKRQKYKRNKQCQCSQTPAIITAPKVPKILPKSQYGLSIWVLIILSKFANQVPTYRLLQQLNWYGLSLAQSTITAGLNKLLPLFEVIFDKFALHCQQETHWHADETRWEVYEKIPGKKTTRWYLWIFRGCEAVSYVLAPTRGYAVVEEFFKTASAGIISCDRYIVYKKLAKNSAIILAFCWAHVRRDFLDVAKSHPSLEPWAMEWVDAIGELYALNNQRIDPETGTISSEHKQQCLIEHLDSMAARCTKQLATPGVHSACQSVLESLQNHWEGLTVFVNEPHVPLDNNRGENGLRGPVVGRKSYYGSGSIWSAKLTAGLFSIFETIKLWDINPQTWTHFYLQACIDNHNNPPDNLTPFLPWTMTKEQLQKMRAPPPT